MGCISHREGRYSKELMYYGTVVTLVEGLLEEFDCDVIGMMKEYQVNIARNPLSSEVRTQAQKYSLDLEQSSERLIDRRERIFIESLPNPIFVNTTALLNYELQTQQTFEQALEEILDYVSNQHQIWQIGFVDHFDLQISYSEYAEQLIKPLFKYLKKPEKSLKSVKILCLSTRHQIKLLKKMMQYENEDY